MLMDSDTTNKKDVPKLIQVPIVGTDLGKGSIMTSEGIVRIPMSKLKKQKENLKKDTTQEDIRNDEPIHSVDIISNLPRRLNPQEKQIKFKSGIGTATGKYFPVINIDDFIVLGLTEQSFIPASYKDNPDMIMSVIIDNKEHDVVFSGCQFKDPETEREYIILIKLKGGRNDDQTI